jgi:hypothetical protein
MTRNEDLLRIVENMAREARRLEGLSYHERLLTVLGRLKDYVGKVEANVREERQKR